VPARRHAAGGLRMTAANGPAIDVVDLHKRYGHVHAVQGITFAVLPGEIFGFLGPNGAGKTTTIRILTGRAHPTSGEVRVLGHRQPAERERIKPLINLVFEEQNVYERLSATEDLRFFASLYGVPRSRADEALDLVGLRDAAKRRAGTYSTGMKQRLLIARALLNRPRLLFLDEPTKGLDPAAARELRDLVRGLAREGTTVFLTTHFMEEADELCTRVAFLSEGRIVALDTPRELKLRYGERTATVLLADRSEHVVALDRAEDAARVDGWMREGQVLTIHSREGTLEDVFVALAGRRLL